MKIKFLPEKKQKINVPKANEKSKRGKNKGVVDVKKAAVVSSKAEVKEVSSTKVLNLVRKVLKKAMQTKVKLGAQAKKHLQLP